MMSLTPHTRDFRVFEQGMKNKESLWLKELLQEANQEKAQEEKSLIIVERFLAERPPDIWHL